MFGGHFIVILVFPMVFLQPSNLGLSMNNLTTLLKSSIGRKLMMALTGIFLILFLVIHLIGNLQLLIPDGGEAFNIYAYTMGNNPLIQLVSKLNFLFIILHIIYSIWLGRLNKAARPVAYAGKAAEATSSLSSRNMGILGTLILVFLLVHLKGFWYEFKTGADIAMVTYGNLTVPDVFPIVATAYQELWYVAFYVVMMVAVGFHLFHGFQSAFQTLGLGYNKYKKTIQGVGTVYAILIPALFALIPIVMYFQNA